MQALLAPSTQHPAPSTRHPPAFPGRASAPASQMACWPAAPPHPPPAERGGRSGGGAVGWSARDPGADGWRGVEHGAHCAAQLLTQPKRQGGCGGGVGTCRPRSAQSAARHRVRRCCSLTVSVTTAAGRVALPATVSTVSRPSPGDTATSMRPKELSPLSRRAGWLLPGFSIRNRASPACAGSPATARMAPPAAAAQPAARWFVAPAGQGGTALQRRHCDPQQGGSCRQPTATPPPAGWGRGATPTTCGLQRGLPGPGISTCVGQHLIPGCVANAAHPTWQQRVGLVAKQPGGHAKLAGGGGQGFDLRRAGQGSS